MAETRSGIEVPSSYADRLQRLNIEVVPTLTNFMRGRGIEKLAEACRRMDARIPTEVVILLRPPIWIAECRVGDPGF